MACADGFSARFEEFSLEGGSRFLRCRPSVVGLIKAL
jgi:hypothetical protein